MWVRSVNLLYVIENQLFWGLAKKLYHRIHHRKGILKVMMRAPKTKVRTRVKKKRHSELTRWVGDGFRRATGRSDDGANIKVLVNLWDWFIITYIERRYLKNYNYRMMSKNLFTADFEINASKKMLYPYLNTASGLSQWFAEDVTVNEDKVYNFIWDDEDHKARMTAYRTNHYVKFQFLPEDGDDEEDPAFFELRLEMNELTQSVFIKITDYSLMDDQDELMDLWESMIDALKETVGG